MHGVSLAFAATALCLAGCVPALAQQTDATSPSVSADPADTDRVPLYLEVTLNGKSTNLVAEFALEPGSGRMFSPKSELEQVGLDGRHLPEGMVNL